MGNHRIANARCGRVARQRSVLKSALSAVRRNISIMQRRGTLIECAVTNFDVSPYKRLFDQVARGLPDKQRRDLAALVVAGYGAQLYVAAVSCIFPKFW